MDATFTIYFEDPFWVGLLESEDEGALVVARHVFGAEPSNAQLLHFMLYEFHRMRRSAPAKGSFQAVASGHRNPKRAIREARRDQVRPPSTKAQAALSAALEASKTEREINAREERRAHEDRRYELRAEKRKKRHEGH
jgi:hypothetical protein